MTLSEELIWRGFFNQTTYKDITVIDRQPITFYFGVDPSAPSMTIGNLATALMVRHFISHGHNAVLLVGGATGMIGDPDGKDKERQLKSSEEINSNKAGITSQYQRIFNNQHFQLVDNYDWFKDLGYLNFLRDIGKHVPLRQMLGRDFVQSRLSEDGSGISYAEFSYVLIQAFDFLHLNKEYNVTLQLCGSDQWGNSIAGVDLIRRVSGKETHIWSAPLIINKTTGKKFGKSEDGAIWLDETKTSVYKFYQFWLNTNDDAVEEYLKIYTILDKNKIDETMQAFDNNRSSRSAQKCLAYEVTSLVHGEERATEVQKVTEAIFSGDYSKLTQENIDMLLQEIPSFNATRNENIINLLVSLQLATSMSDARRLLNQGAIYVNNNQIDISYVVNDESLLVNNYLIVKRGKFNTAILKIIKES
ncbi:MAG: tyrosine--tRNA ligase [Candidatus Saccharimonadales bacterium]